MERVQTRFFDKKEEYKATLNNAQKNTKLNDSIDKAIKSESELV